MKISSDFAVLDVKEGRDELNQHFAERPTFGECPEHLRVPVVIRGYIDQVVSNDDGVSREFGITVTELEVGE